MIANTNAVAKIAAVVAGLALAGSSFVAFAPTARAQSVADLQAQINALLAQIAALQGGSTGGASVTFTRDLTIGSTGADVQALQSFLMSKGYSIPSGPTTYFGTQTQAALAAYQAANGIAPAAGYFGPITRAKVNASGGTTTGGGTTGGALRGDAGSISISSYTSDVEDEINTGDSENVLGFKIEADGDSDVEITNIKVSLEYTGSSSNRLERYFDSFDIKMDGKVIASLDADEFSRDSAGKYSKTFSLRNAIIREGDESTFYVVAHAAGTIDTADAAQTWTVKANNFRFVDAAGAIVTENDEQSNTGVNVIKLASSGDVRVRISLAPSNPGENTVKVSDDTSGDLVTLLEWRVKAEGTDISFDRVRFDIATTSENLSTMVSEFRLMRGSTVVETADMSDTAATTSNMAVLTFDLDDEETVDKDDTETYRLVAKMNKNTFVGASITASISNSSSYYLNAEDGNGDPIAAGRFSGSAIGNKQTFRADGLFAEIDTTNAVRDSKVVNNTSQQYGEFTFVVDITADGDDFYFASTSAPFDFDILNASTGVVDSGANASSTATLTSNATKTAGGDYVIYDGETKRVTYKITMGIVVPAGSYKAVLNTFDFGDAANALTNQTAINLTPVADFTTDSVTIQ